MSILEQIVADKRVEIAARKTAEPLDAWRNRALSRAAPPRFVDALRAAPMGLIAEVKKRSPSAGEIRDPFDAAQIARAYESASAQAISVLVDRKYFDGGEDRFEQVRAAVALPLLYKEFVVDPWQVWHAAALGASAILLIAAVLSPDELRRFLDLCAEARLDALLEVHDEAEMRVARDLDTPFVGINNRDLRVFQTSLETTERLAPLAPAGCTLVSESGIRGPDDVLRVRRAGARAVLVGEHLLRRPDLESAVRDLMSPAWETP